MVIQIPIYFEISWDGDKGPDAKEIKKLLRKEVEDDFLSSSPMTIKGSWFSSDRVRARPLTEKEVKERLRTSK